MTTTETPLAASFYTDPSVFERDRDAIFYKTWQCVCHVSEVADPGSYITHDLVAESVFVLRGKDGILRGWIDGRPAFEKTDLRYRLVDKLRIEQVWMNIYHGGKRPSPYDQHAFIDNVVIAREYVGPAVE